jgi:predicted HicB family RNase H-like nuclease
MKQVIYPLRLERTLYQAMQQAAKRQFIPLSNWLRRVIHLAVEKEKDHGKRG